MITVVCVIVLGPNTSAQNAGLFTAEKRVKALTGMSTKNFSVDQSAVEEWELCFPNMFRVLSSQL